MRRERWTAMAEGSQRIRPHGETRGAICGVQYTKFGKRKPGIAPLQIVLDRSHEHYFKFGRDPLFQTLKAIDKSISAAIYFGSKLQKYGAKNVIKVTFRALLRPLRRRHEFSRRRQVNLSSSSGFRGATPRYYWPISEFVKWRRSLGMLFIPYASPVWRPEVLRPVSIRKSFKWQSLCGARLTTRAVAPKTAKRAPSFATIWGLSGITRRAPNSGPSGGPTGIRGVPLYFCPIKLRQESCWSQCHFPPWSPLPSWPACCDCMAATSC